MMDWEALGLNYNNPDYPAIFRHRAGILDQLRADSELMQSTKNHYKAHPWDFINDWGMTYDPRAIEEGRIANIPFILWPKQREYVEWLYRQWQSGERGLVEKSRDCGVTWLSVGFAVALWCFHDGVAIGFGSRKEGLVDKLGDPDSIFEKIRHMVGQLPVELLPNGYETDKNSSFMRLISPNTGASITGEAGDNIGRGGRKSVFFVDEAAFIEHQAVVDKALSQATNCQIDISTFNGAGNPFYEKWNRFKGTSRHFVFDWRDDPRKDEAWYQRQKDEQSESTVAQEIDRDPLASNTDAFIPAQWIKASVDAHIKLGFAATGIKVTGFDPADTGDAKGVVVRHGSVITEAIEMTGGDITQALPWAFNVAEEHRSSILCYDGDGMGSPAIKLYMMSAAASSMKITEYRGSGEIEDKKKPYSGKRDGISKTNADTFANFKSQSWTWVYDRFRKTYDAIQKQEQGLLVNADPEELISISSDCKAFNQLISELSQPRRVWTKNGKIAVESKKEMKARNVKSPNVAEAAIMAMSVRKDIGAEISGSILDRYTPHRVNDATVGY